MYMYLALLEPTFLHKGNFYLPSVYFDLMFLGRRRGQRACLKCDLHFCVDVVLACNCFSQILEWLRTVGGSRGSSVSTELRVGRSGNRGSMSGRAGNLCHLQSTQTGS